MRSREYAMQSVKEKILTLMQGYPQDWIYIERKVTGDLLQPASEGVRAPMQFVGKNLSELFKKDLMDVNTRKIAMVRPVIGPNGIGKSTQLEIQVRKYVEEVFKEKHVYLFFDFRHVSDTADEFWAVFIQKLYENIKDKKYLQTLCKLLPADKLKPKLLDYFKNTELVAQIINIISDDDTNRLSAEEYMLSSKNSSKKNILDFFFGFVKLAIDLDRIVVLCFDELQFLVTIDPSQTLVKIILEQFIRKIVEEFRTNRLYVVISCLQNPDVQEYDALKKASKSFGTIVDGKEIFLGPFSTKERNELIEQVAAQIGMSADKKIKFMSTIKGRLEYHVPRQLLLSVAEVLEKMGFTSYSPAELRNIYEKESREHVKPMLDKKGFVNVEEGPATIGGYNFDIYASFPSDRAKRVPKAFGEITITKRTAMKAKIEKYMGWLSTLKGNEYKPGAGDYVFFVCPSNRLTEGCQELLASNDVEAIEFDSSVFQELDKIEVSDDEAALEGEGETASEGEAGGEGGVIAEDKERGVKQANLDDIPGIGPVKLKLLHAAGITSVDDLIACSTAATAKRVKGLGEASLNKWKQAAKQLLENISS